MATVVVLALAGCPAHSRPPELVTFEKLREDPMFSDSDRRAFDLLAAADNLLIRAEAGWERGDAHRAREDALQGQIKMKTALAILDAERQKARLVAADAALALSQEEESRLEDQLATTSEELALLERLHSMKRSAAEERKSFTAQIESTRKQAAAERQRLVGELAAQKRRTEALDGIRSAELAVRMAETVDAPRYSGPKYAAASAMLKGAHKAFDAGQWDDVVARTGLCRVEAEEATGLARPQYEKAIETTNARLRNRTLEVDATALPGVRVRLERDEDVQRLVLVLGDLFAENKAVFLPQGANVIDAVDGLLAKYPTYSVQITGFTDDQGKPAELSALSLARANAVYWALVSRGIDSRRLSVDEKGSGEPIADNSTPGGRAKNARVELAILYHIAQ